MQLVDGRSPVAERVESGLGIWAGMELNWLEEMAKGTESEPKVPKSGKGKMGECPLFGESVAWLHRAGMSEMSRSSPEKVGKGVQQRVPSPSCVIEAISSSPLYSRGQRQPRALRTQKSYGSIQTMVHCPRAGAPGVGLPRSAQRSHSVSSGPAPVQRDSIRRHARHGRR